MIKRTGLWCLVVSLMTLSLVSAMPSSTTSPTSTTSRYHNDDGTILNTTISTILIAKNKTTLIYMQALRRLTNLTINEKTQVTNNNDTDAGRDTKELHPVNNENYIKISLINNDTKGSRKQAHQSKKPEATTLSKITKVALSPNQRFTLKNATVMFHRGTVGGGTNTTQKSKLKPTWPYSIINSKNDLNRYKNYTQLTRRRNSNSTKNNELKQPDFLLYHIPGVDPMPEVTSYSPQYTFERPPQNLDSSQSQIDNIVPISAVETSSNGYPLEDPSDIGDIVDIPLGTVDLDLIPEAQNSPGLFYAAEDNPACPSYHLTSNVFGPQSKQGCPDLNVVLNSHYHPSSDTRRPEVPAAEATPLADPGAPAAAPAAPAAAAPAGGAPGGGSGGFPQLGIPQLPEFPGLPELSLPDLKGLGGLLQWLWNGLRAVFRFIWPFLVAIPVIVFTKTLVATFIALFPWWFPALFFVAKSDNSKEKKHYHYKHVHKPVVHPDGWFWNHSTKTWTNILDRTKNTRPGHAHPHIHIKHKRSLEILRNIEEFKAKFR